MNKVVLLGRLTKDPELRYTKNETAVCGFTLAVDRKFQKDETDFIPVVVWQKTAEFCSKYFAKGQKVAVSGRIQTRTWEDENGDKHYVTEIVAEEVDFADGKKNSEQQSATAEKSAESKSANITSSKPPWMA